MNSKQLIKSLRADFKKKADLGYKKGVAIVNIDNEDMYGVRFGNLKAIARKHFSEVKDLEIDEMFVVAEDLLKTGNHELKHTAFVWTLRRKKDFQRKHFAIFQRWIEKYVTDWALCDDFCTHSPAELIILYPDLIPKIKKWATSRNMWLRRAAAVTFVMPGRKGMFHKDIYQIADILLEDKEDLVQKGYGWMLKETSKSDQKAVFNYVMKNKRKMPRTALRYAIEKMPPQLRKKAMAL
ncbi:DNA alkylation repair protein [Patescibacteria group bacterium]